MAYLRDILAWFRSQEERAVDEAACLRHTTRICAGWCVGGASASRSPILEARLCSKILFLYGYLASEWNRINYLRVEVCALRGRLVALSTRATREETWVRRDGAFSLEVNNEDERLNFMHNLM